LQAALAGDTVMKFTIGDRILLKKTNEEGFVTNYIDKQMIEVKIGGTVFPVHMDEIDHPYLKWFTGKTAKKKGTPPEQLPVEKIAGRQQRLANGVHLSFMPVYKTEAMEEVVDTIKIYLLNELPQNIKFVYDVRMATRSLFRHEGSLHGFGNVYLHSIAYADMNDQPRFNWQLTDVGNDKMDVAEGVLRIKPQKLFEHITELMKSGGPSFRYTLIDDFAAKQKKEPADTYLPPVPQPATPLVTARTIEAARQEIDLHIENLVDNMRGLSNADIVKIQLDTLQRYLNLAIVHRQERMVVVHGLGKGRLREEVHAVLKTVKEVSRFKNEWSGKYGFGATEIWFRY